MLSLALTATLLAAPPPPLPPPSPLPASAQLWDRDLPGGMRLEIVRELTWPGPYLPAFTLAHGQRVVHRMMLSFTRSPLRRVSFEAISVGPTLDPRQTMTSGAPTREALPAFALRGNIALPRTQWKLSVQQSFAGYASTASTPLGGRRPGGIGLPVLLLGRRL